MSLVKCTEVRKEKVEWKQPGISKVRNRIEYLGGTGQARKCIANRQ